MLRREAAPVLGIALTLICKVKIGRGGVGLF